MDRSDQKPVGQVAEGVVQSPELALAKLTQAQTDLIASAKKLLPPALFDEWTQRSQERFGAVDRRKRALSNARQVDHTVCSRLWSLAQWDLMDFTVPRPLRLSPALDRLLRSLPMGLFIGTGCARMDYLTHGAAKREEWEREDVYSPSEVQEAVQRLENRRLVVRYAVKARRVCFLVFSHPVSDEFTQAIQQHVQPDVLSFPLVAPSAHALRPEKAASASDPSPLSN